MDKCDKMNLCIKTLRKAEQTNDSETWTKYKDLRNNITSELRVAKCDYYKQLFDEVKDCRTYWNLIKRNSEKNKGRPILAIREPNGTLEITDTGKANILNEYFSTIGEKLANECLTPSTQNQVTNIHHITPTIMNIDLKGYSSQNTSEVHMKDLTDF